MKKLLLIGLLIIGCDNNSTEPNAENYLFNLNLTDSTGEPINNTEFLVRYVPENNLTESDDESYRSTTTIDCAIGLQTFNSLIVYNLNNVAVDTLINDTLDAGTYSFNFDCSDCDNSYKAGLKVFMYVLESSNLETNEVIFREMKYMVIIDGAIDLNVLSSAGFTDENGTFQTDSIIWFPTLYDVPEMTKLDKYANIMGNFYLTDLVSDSIEIRINIAESIYIKKHKITNGINNIEMVIPDILNRNYESTSYQQNYSNFTPAIYGSNPISFISVYIDLPYDGFSLAQNYPNPFN